MLIIATFVLFTVLVAVISGYKTRDDKLDSQEDYFLARRGALFHLAPPLKKSGRFAAMT